MQRNFLLIKVLFLFSFSNSFSQMTLLPNEESFFSFKTKTGKTIDLVHDKNYNYILFRSGTDKKIELEYPKKDKESWKIFKYYYYQREGIIEKEHADINYVSFVYKYYKYVIYDTFVAATNKSKVGLLIVNLSTNKKTDIVGDIKSKKGSLAEFRDNNLLEIEEELFDKFVN